MPWLWRQRGRWGWDPLWRERGWQPSQSGSYTWSPRRRHNPVHQRYCRSPTRRRISWLPKADTPRPSTWWMWTCGCQLEVWWQRRRGAARCQVQPVQTKEEGSWRRDGTEPSGCLVDELMSQKTYAAELEEFTIYAVPRGLDVRDSEGLDRLLVDYMNLLYLKGHQAYKADRLAASILHHYPQYGRHGDSKLPRLWRALKGFKKLCPAKSRLAYPLAIWAAVATRMRQLGHARMGLFVLMAVSTYGRPSEMLRLRVFSLVRPSPGITRNWTLLMSPEERPERSKTGDYDVSLSLDSPWMTSWSHTLFCLLKDNHPEAPLWDFDYNEYSKVFKKVTPYQTRHSGPSIDRARGYRSQGEVQKRGRLWSQWFATRSRLA